MCGIVGFFAKDATFEPRLGALLAGMLTSMADRGPDSAGFAIYRQESLGLVKLTVQSQAPERDFGDLAAKLGAAVGAPVLFQRRDTHGVLQVPDAGVEAACAFIKTHHPGLRIMAVGQGIEIYKEIGAPAEVAARFALAETTGTHGIGHTRMATESAVTTLGAHPFSTGPDQCLVHNGSLSNHNNIRRVLKHDGMQFETDNDTEVAAAYLTWRMGRGQSLGEALENSLDDLDGFYTFVVGTRTGFGVLRDAIACKPAVLAETEHYVAFGSEYRALAGLPGIEAARIWEPEPATVYSWER
jgi:amidophosphoribosyltransferase